MGIVKLKQSLIRILSSVVLSWPKLLLVNLIIQPDCWYNLSHTGKCQLRRVLIEILHLKTLVPEGSISFDLTKLWFCYLSPFCWFFPRFFWSFLFWFFLQSLRFGLFLGTVTILCSSSLSLGHLINLELVPPCEHMLCNMFQPCVPRKSQGL